MTWCNDSDEERGIDQLVAPTITPTSTNNTTVLTDHRTKASEIRTLTCPSCGQNIEFQDQVLKIKRGFDSLTLIFVFLFYFIKPCL